MSLSGDLTDKVSSVEQYKHKKYSPENSHYIHTCRKKDWILKDSESEKHFYHQNGICSQCDVVANIVFGCMDM